MTPTTAPFRIVKFWTEYKRAAGGLKEVDMVEYCAVGMAGKSTTVARIADLRRVREAPDPDDVASNIAKQRWEFIERHYIAWKSNQAVPEHGTPLAAWPGITAAQAEIFRQIGLRSVEDIANATDSVINRVQLPGVRDSQQNAKAFLESRDAARTADDLAQKDRQIAALSEQLEELRQIVIAQSQAQPADGEDAPRRRGRPPKVETEAAA